MGQLKRNLILLAGGRSKRMRFPKGLLDYSGEPWIIHQLNYYKQIGIRLVVLVLGHNWEQYTLQIKGLIDCKDRVKNFRGIDLSLVINSRPKEGSFSSLQCGIKRSLFQNEYPAYVKPIDVPPPQKEVWQDLGTKLKDQRMIAIPSFKNKGGHPVILSTAFMGKLLKISIDDPDARLDAQIRNLEEVQKCYLEVNDRNIHLNINTPAQWKYFTSFHD